MRQHFSTLFYIVFDTLCACILCSHSQWAHALTGLWTSCRKSWYQTRKSYGQQIRKLYPIEWLMALQGQDFSCCLMQAIVGPSCLQTKGPALLSIPQDKLCLQSPFWVKGLGLQWEAEEKKKKINPVQFYIRYFWVQQGPADLFCFPAWIRNLHFWLWGWHYGSFP